MSSAMAILSDKTKKKVRPESRRINIALFVLDMVFPPCEIGKFMLNLINGSPPSEVKRSDKTLFEKDF